MAGGRVPRVRVGCGRMVKGLQGQMMSGDGGGGGKQSRGNMGQSSEKPRKNRQSRCMCQEWW